MVAATLERADPRDVLLVRRRRRGRAASLAPRADVVAAPRVARRAHARASCCRGRWARSRSCRCAATCRPGWRIFLPAGAMRSSWRKRRSIGCSRIGRRSARCERAYAARSTRAAGWCCRFATSPARRRRARWRSKSAASNDVAHQAARRAVAIAPTWNAVARERAFLASHGGGCHARDRRDRAAARVRHGHQRQSANRRRAPTSSWSLDGADVPARRADANIWPRPDERDRARSGSELVVAPPPADRALWVSRSDAMPTGSCSPAGSHRVDRRRPDVAQAGRTRGVWVHGCADGLGDSEAADIDALAGRTIAWTRLTHVDAVRDPAEELGDVLGGIDLPADPADRTHLFWTSGTEFRRALDAFPSLRERFHASGPGRTARVISDEVGAAAHARRVDRLRRMAARTSAMSSRTSRCRLVASATAAVVAPARPARRRRRSPTAHLIQPHLHRRGRDGRGADSRAGRRQRASRRGGSARRRRARSRRAACGTSCCSRVPVARNRTRLRFDHAARAVEAIKKRFGDRAASVGRHLSVLVDRSRPLRAARRSTARSISVRRSTRSPATRWRSRMPAPTASARAT